jgi:hypothetical protein
MRGAIPPLPLYAFMEWCLVKRRENFTFLLVLSDLSVCEISHITGRSAVCHIVVMKYGFTSYQALSSIQSKVNLLLFQRIILMLIVRTSYSYLPSVGGVSKQNEKFQ